jgi:hypothetical protein
MYLRIDALCIYQDSKDDREAEAPKMADIYRNSVVTITATASLSLKTGILGPRKTHPACRLPWQVPKVDLMKSLPGDAISQHELVIKRSISLSTGNHGTTSGLDRRVIGRAAVGQCKKSF